MHQAAAPALHFQPPRLRERNVCCWGQSVVFTVAAGLHPLRVATCHLEAGQRIPSYSLSWSQRSGWGCCSRLACPLNLDVLQQVIKHKKFKKGLLIRESFKYTQK